jgi:hypothetical protein
MLLHGADWVATDPMTGDGYELFVDVPMAADSALFRVRN